LLDETSTGAVHPPGKQVSLSKTGIAPAKSKPVEFGQVSGSPEAGCRAAPAIDESRQILQIIQVLEAPTGLFVLLQVEQIQELFEVER
jgi:hypothetical protein